MVQDLTVDPFLPLASNYFDLVVVPAMFQVHIYMRANTHNICHVFSNVYLFVVVSEAARYVQRD